MAPEIERDAVRGERPGEGLDPEATSPAG